MLDDKPKGGRPPIGGLAHLYLGQLRDRVDQLATTWGTSRSGAARRLINEAQSRYDDNGQPRRHRKETK